MLLLRRLGLLCASCGCAVSLLLSAALLGVLPFGTLLPTATPYSREAAAAVLSLCYNRCASCQLVRSPLMALSGALLLGLLAFLALLLVQLLVLVLVLVYYIVAAAYS